MDISIIQNEKSIVGKYIIYLSGRITHQYVHSFRTSWDEAQMKSGGILSRTNEVLSILATLDHLMPKIVSFIEWVLLDIKKSAKHYRYEFLNSGKKTNLSWRMAYHQKMTQAHLFQDSNDKWSVLEELCLNEDFIESFIVGMWAFIFGVLANDTYYNLNVQMVGFRF